MTSMDIKASETAHDTRVLWTEGYDGRTHYANVLKALTPALFILVAATALLVAVL